MQAQTPPAPPVVIRNEDMAKLLATYPTVGEGRSRLVLMGVTVTGDVDLLQNAKSKLDQEGWNSFIMKDRTGRTLLSVGTEHRSLQQASALFKRIKAKEFGAVDAQPLFIPAPSEAKK